VFVFPAFGWYAFILGLTPEVFSVFFDKLLMYPKHTTTIYVSWLSRKPKLFCLRTEPLYNPQRSTLRNTHIFLIVKPLKELILIIKKYIYGVNLVSYLAFLHKQKKQFQKGAIFSALLSSI